jgi:hypothetical protein
MGDNSERDEITYWFDLHLDTHCLPYLVDIVDKAHYVLEDEINSGQLKEDTLDCDDLSRLIADDLLIKYEKYRDTFPKLFSDEDIEHFFQKKDYFDMKFHEKWASALLGILDRSRRVFQNELINNESTNDKKDNGACMGKAISDKLISNITRQMLIIKFQKLKNEIKNYDKIEDKTPG